MDFSQEHKKAFSIAEKGSDPACLSLRHFVSNPSVWGAVKDPGLDTWMSCRLASESGNAFIMCLSPTQDSGLPESPRFICFRQCCVPKTHNGFQDTWCVVNKCCE